MQERQRKMAAERFGKEKKKKIERKYKDQKKVK